LEGQFRALEKPQIGESDVITLQLTENGSDLLSQAMIGLERQRLQQRSENSC